ncbi:MAG: GatB/YqeY domain-containing protein [bacterium]
MSLQDRLSDDLKLAMKARDALKVGTLRMVRAQLIDAEIARGDALNEDEVLGVLNNAAKKRKEAIAMYEKSSRDDLLAKEKEELEIITAYLPEQLSKEEIERVVSEIIADTGATTQKDLGKVMSSAMQQLKGKADGKVVQEMVRQKLA